MANKARVVVLKDVDKPDDGEMSTRDHDRDPGAGPDVAGLDAFAAADSTGEDPLADPASVG